MFCMKDADFPLNIDPEFGDEQYFCLSQVYDLSIDHLGGIYGDS